jgi:hypothetical protein
MFFIRTTLLLGLGVLVLPTDEASQARVTSSAKTALNWSMTFCDRNAETCVQSRQAWAIFVKKAEFGAKMAFDLFSERNAQTAEAPPAQKPAAAQQPAEPVARQRGTLKPGDMEPAWRGKMARVGG